MSYFVLVEKNGRKWNVVKVDRATLEFAVLETHTTLAAASESASNIRRARK